jgi:hypothetical protein
MALLPGQHIGESGFPEWTPEHLAAEAAAAAAAAAVVPEEPPAPIPDPAPPPPVSPAPASLELVAVAAAEDAAPADDEEEEDNAAGDDEEQDGPANDEPRVAWMEKTLPEMVQAGWIGTQFFRGAKDSGSVWRECKKITDTHPGRAQGSTHMCIAKLPDGNLCCRLFKLRRRNRKRDRDGNPAIPDESSKATWHGSIVNKHNDKHHAKVTVQAAKAGAMRTAAVAATVAATAGAAITPENKGNITAFLKTNMPAKWARESRQKVALMNYYIYSTTSVSQRTFICPYLRGMVTAADAEYPRMDRHSVILWVRVEFKLFKIFLNFVLEECRQRHAGHAFIQLSEDATHLKNHKRYVSKAYNLVWRNSVMNIARAFTRSQAKKAAAVAEELKGMLEEDKIDVEELTGLIVDFAELAVARQMGVEKEGCTMHNASKIIPLTFGIKDHTRMKEVFSRYFPPLFISPRHCRPLILSRKAKLWFWRSARRLRISAIAAGLMSSTRIAGKLSPPRQIS